MGSSPACISRLSLSGSLQHSLSGPWMQQRKQRQKASRGSVTVTGSCKEVVTTVSRKSAVKVAVTD